MRLKALTWLFAGAALVSVTTAQVLGEQCPGGQCQDGTTCSGGFCGGTGAFCEADDVARYCRPTFNCLKRQCSSLQPVNIGETCFADQQCPGTSTCSESELICGGEISNCRTADGLSGPSDDCVDGYQCISGSCSSTGPIPIGADCNPNDPTRRNFCAAGSQCSYDDNSCGGLLAFCIPDDGALNGPSSQCRSDLSCLRNQCTTLSAVAEGGRCVSATQCTGNTQCTNGICGGEGSSCYINEPSLPYFCAPTLTCRDNTCTRFPSVELGEDCVINSQCPGDAQCSASGICGGVNTFCIPDAGGSTGDSVFCASGNTCLQNQCSALPEVAPGGACLIDSQCAGSLRCAPDGKCGGVGAYCFNPFVINDDDLCANNNICVNNYCAVSRRTLGQSCTSNGQCDRDPTTFVTPTCSFSATSICGGEGSFCSAGTAGYCASGYTCQGNACTLKTQNLCSSGNNPCLAAFQCSNGVCGGLGAPCTVRPGSTTGATTNCASGYICLKDTCTPERPVAIGGACGSNRQCPAGVTCGEGICGGANAQCVTADGSDVGLSTQCANGYNCLDGYCRLLPISALGESCAISQQCQGTVTCSSGVCGGQSASCSDASYCADGYVCDKYSQCSRLPQAVSGATCSSDSQCPADVRCSNNICGGENALCNGDSSLCAPNYACLRNGLCSANAPSELDGACVDDDQCPGGATCTRGECGALGGGCTADSDCGANLGGQCTSDRQCPDAAGFQVYCREGICGGYGATCYVDSNPDQTSSISGPSSQCDPDYTCLRGFCSPREAAQVGDQCGLTGQCLGSSECSQNVCGGPGAFCFATDGSGSGPSDQCARDLNCLNNRCIRSVLGNPLGGECNNDSECEAGVYCSDSGICGGNGALCDADQFCFSSNCDDNDFICISGASPVPNPVPKKRELNLQRRRKVSPCPPSQIACPVFPKGFECIDPMSNLEGCGGCVWGKSVGVDCTSLPNVEDVDCRLGKCIIKSCVEGYTYQQGNQTCVFDM